MLMMHFKAAPVNNLDSDEDGIQDSWRHIILDR